MADGQMQFRPALTTETMFETFFGLATIVAPIAGLFGYRGRYDEYSGPLD